MDLREAVKICEILEEKFENTCPNCGKKLFQGSIDEYYTALCECGLEIKIKI